MLKGHVFNLQTFTSDAFALFIDKFLNKRCGVATGCSLSNTNNSVTIADGYFVIRGRFLQIISGVTISNISTNGFYSLVCEIDLSKENTTTQLNQAEIKVLYNANAYPTLTQQDLTNGGTLFQYEFATFKVEAGNISNFIDKRTYVNFESIYDQVEGETQALIDEIEQTLDDVLDESIYVLKSQTGTIISRNYSNGTTTPTGGENGDLYDQYFD